MTYFATQWHGIAKADSPHKLCGYTYSEATKKGIVKGRALTILFYYFDNAAPIIPASLNNVAIVISVFGIYLL